MTCKMPIFVILSLPIRAGNEGEELPALRNAEHISSGGYKDFSDSYSFVHDLEPPCGKADLVIGEFLEHSRSPKWIEEIDRKYA